MGVDFYACNVCEETFADCGYYEYCECGKHWCSDECSKEDGLREEKHGFKPEGSTWEQETSCNYCRKEDYDDYELLQYALIKFSLSREELIESYKTQRK